MANFFTDNADLSFTLEHLDLAEAVDMIEAGYSYAKEFDSAPRDFKDALDNYRRVLAVVG